MPSPTKAPTPRRAVVLAAILVVVATWALLHRPGQDETSLVGDGERLSYTSQRPADLVTTTTLSRRDGGGPSQRNPFTFGVPPTPTPNLTPQPTRPPQPTPTPRPTPTPTPHGWKGPPPPFDRTYIGHFGPPGGAVAVFRQSAPGDESPTIEVAYEGMVLDGTFVVLRIGYDAVVIGYLEFPEETRVPLADN